MIWSEPIQRFIVLAKKQAYFFDPSTSQLASIQNVRLHENERQFVSCTCSDDKLFIVTSESYDASYLHHYKLPDITFISRLTMTDLIGVNTRPKPISNRSSRKEIQEPDSRKIICMQYKQQRPSYIR